MKLRPASCRPFYFTTYRIHYPVHDLPILGICIAEFHFVDFEIRIKNHPRVTNHARSVEEELEELMKELMNKLFPFAGGRKAKAMRKRGADTNQMIFYLIGVVLAIAAAAYGLDQGMRGWNRSTASQNMGLLSGNIRSMYANVGNLPAFTQANVINADVLPKSMVQGATVILPNGGLVTVAQVGAAGSSRDFTATLAWAAATSRGAGICNSLAGGAAANDYFESGPLGMDYTVTAAPTCTAGAASSIVVRYHR